MSYSSPIFKPIVNHKELLIVEPDGCIAVCTLWSKKEKWRDFVFKSEHELVAVVGNLYDIDGIHNMFRNLMANPQITDLYVCGNDINKELITSIQAAFEMGLELQVRDVGSVHVHPQHVQVVVRREKILETLVVNSQFPPKKPQYFHPPKIENNADQAFDHPGFLIHANTAQEGWEELKKLILTNGRVQSNRYGGMKEILNLTVVLKEFGPKKFLGDPDKANRYATSLLTGADKDTTYNYGERLNKGVGVKGIIDRIYSRNAYWPVWLPEDIDNKEPPCLVSAWFRECNGALVGAWAVRSQDMYRGWPLNVYGFYKYQEFLANVAKLKMGHFVINTYSAHIYERDWEHPPSMKQTYLQDPAGNFIISVEEDHIQVDLMKGSKVISRFEGRTALSLQNKIQHLVRSVPHAMYLGRELRKAEERLT